MLIATDSFSDAVNDMWLNKKTLEVKKKKPPLEYNQNY